MGDMFPGAAGLGDNLNELFTGSKPDSFYHQLQEENRLYNMQGMGVNHEVLQGGKANVADKNSPQYGNEKNRPTPTEDPQEVEARWIARLTKFAGIAQSTGVKMGGL